jgi:hypothetical protein
MITFTLPDKTFEVLAHLHFPIVACAEHPFEPGANLNFVDVPAVLEYFVATGAYQVVTAGEREKPIRQDDLVPLGPSELDQVRYWKPERIGDVVFNFWD